MFLDLRCKWLEVVLFLQSIETDFIFCWNAKESETKEARTKYNDIPLASVFYKPVYL